MRIIAISTYFSRLFSAVEEVQDPLTHEFVPERTYGCLPADEQGMGQENLQTHVVIHEL